MTTLLTEKITEYTVDLNNWLPVAIVVGRYPQFTLSQLNALFRLRRVKPCLSICYRRIGGQGYINVPLFGFWLSGLLPDQQMWWHKWVRVSLLQVVKYLRLALIIASMFGA